MKKIITAREAIAVFEEDYFQRRRRNPKSETTWKLDYLAIFKKLPDEPITQDSLLRTILATEPDSRTRKRCCLVLGALAKFLKLDCDFTRYKGTHSFTNAGFRDLPDEAQIVEWFYKIDNPNWRWAYGMLATYGLRPHELFHLDLSKLKKSTVLSVLDGKTGARQVWPFYPEWVDQFKLQESKPPKVTGKTNSDLGMRCTRQFNRIGLPFRAYDLRHCWAIRTMDFGLETPLAAKQMGNSVKIFTEVYLAWVNERRQQAAVDVLLKRENRPLPPGHFSNTHRGM